MSTVLWQRIEGALVLGAMLVVLYWLNHTAMGPGASNDRLSLWVLALVFFAPDLSFAGYLAGPRIGAVIYNLAHLYGFGLVMIAVGLVTSPQSDLLVTLGVLWVAHAGFDRMLGYGLKEPSAFTVTHLGRIGRDRK